MNKQETTTTARERQQYMDALDRLEEDARGYLGGPRPTSERLADLATVREALERLREEWMTDPETGESFRLKPGALLAEIQRLREEGAK